MAVERIVSLLPSSTEIVCALGFQDRLVGRSHECDFPAGVESLPVCTESKIELKGTSYEIDQRIKAVLQEALSVYRVHADLLERLEPQVIVTQSQCEVCAVSLKDVEAAVCNYLGSRPQIVALEPNSLEDVREDFHRVARALNVPERGEQMVSAFDERLKAIARKAAGSPTTPRVACIEWIEPLMGAGNWMPELVEMAGGREVFGKAGQHSPWITWEDLVAADPDVVVVLPCGFGIERAAAEMQVMVARREWAALQAVRKNQVYVTDGHHYFNRPGPRLADSLEMLAEILHPELFSFGHEGKGWRRWQQS